MSNRLVLQVVLFILAAGCNRAPTPEPEKTIPDKVVPNLQAATPAAPGAVTDQANGMTNPSNSGDPAATTGGPPLNDSQVARITNDANSAEVEQGKLARSKAKDPRVKKFAERMVKHHTEAKDKQAKLNLQTASSDMAMKLEQDADKTLSDLKANSDASFDAEYMADQVKEHQQVLDSIDRDLLPSAKNDDLKSYLKDIRSTVESHLKDARDIQTKLAQPIAQSNTLPNAQPNMRTGQPVNP